MSGDEAGSLDETDYDWFVWRVEVHDPQRLVPEGIGERTGPAVADMALGLGCVFDYCSDDDSIGDVPYYAWFVKAPRVEHLRRDAPDRPVAIARIWEYLRGELPASLQDWSIGVDRDLTVRLYVEQWVREDYRDLLAPVEVALLGLRRDGAQNLEPSIQPWAFGDHGDVATTFVMQVAKHDHRAAFSPWIVLTVGAAMPPAFWSCPLGQRVRRYGHEPGHPMLLLPRPAEPVWLAGLTVGNFTDNGLLRGYTSATGARHQWSSQDSQVLADRLSTDLRALFPRLAHEPDAEL